MLYLLALPLLIIVGVLIFLLLQPGEINVRRMLTMRCTPIASICSMKCGGMTPLRSCWRFPVAGITTACLWSRER